MKNYRVASLVLLAAACASSPAPVATTAPTQPVPSTSAAVDPVGTYEFSTIIDGQTLTGTVHIEGAPLNYRGRVVTKVFPDMPITSVSVAANVISFVASMGGDDVLVRMVMDGSNFQGSWQAGPDSGDISGRKLPK